MPGEHEPRVPDPGLGDSGRELERHALRNVRWLVEKLHYKDAFDQRKDRAVLIGLVVVAAGLILAMAIHTILGAPKPEAAQLAKCEQDFRVARVWEHKSELARKHPDMPAPEIARRVELHWNDMKSLAKIACRGGYKDGG